MSIYHSLLLFRGLLKKIVTHCFSKLMSACLLCIILYVCHNDRPSISMPRCLPCCLIVEMTKCVTFLHSLTLHLLPSLFISVSLSLSLSLSLYHSNSLSLSQSIFSFSLSYSLFHTPCSSMCLSLPLSLPLRWLKGRVF